MFVGYRGWRIRNISGRMMLESPSHSSKSGDRYFWYPGENIARCPYGCTDIPGEDCDCGIYCLQSPEPDLVHYGPDIIGQVILYGDKILEGTVGYRSSHAMISLFLLPSVEPLPLERLEELSETYHAPLVKAEGAILKAIEAARKDRLIKRGMLPYTAAIERYRRWYAWKNKREYLPDFGKGRR